MPTKNYVKATVGNMPELPYAIEEAVNRLRVNIGFLGEDVRKIMVISTHRMKVRVLLRCSCGDSLQKQVLRPH